MYDRQTESWWQQFGGEAIVGELTGKELRQLPAAIVAWEEFRRAHPDGRVLSRDTGFGRSYGEKRREPGRRPPTPQGTRRLPRTRRRAGCRPLLRAHREEGDRLEIGGDELVVTWNPGTRSALDSGVVASNRDVGTALVRSAETGKLVVHDLPFWFAVAAFAPEAEIVRG